MNLHGIVAVSGKPGLWKALAQNKTGFVLESLDAAKSKLVVNLSTSKLAALDEITVFGEDEDIKLTGIFEKMKTAAAAPEAKADGNTLRDYFYEVAPDHDARRVYTSDIKKIITWFGILKDRPEFNEEKKADTAVDNTPDAGNDAQPIEDNPAAETVAPASAAKKKAAKK